MSFLGSPPQSDASLRLYEADLEADGYVANLTRLWCWRPDALEAFRMLFPLLAEGSALTAGDRAVLVAATVSALGDSYCSLAWGARLAALTDERTAAGVPGGGSDGLGERERALAGWARHVVRDPSGTTAREVAALRRVGLDERTIFEATLLVALRIAFASVNDALGAPPDLQLAEEAPRVVREAVTHGRSPG